MSGGHRHDRADLATQRAALSVARALLHGDPQSAATATLGASCPVCLALTSAHLAIGLAAEVSGGGWPVSEELRARMLTVIGQAGRDLDAAGN
jgi:hypothetical protein